jgi:hypothetical protein
MGVRHFCIGWDVTILNAAWRANGDGMRALFGGLGGGARKTKAKAAAKGKRKPAKGNYR